MKINTATVLEDLEGSPLKDGDKTVTLGTIAKGALLAGFPDEKLSGEEKNRRFELAFKIVKDGEFDLEVEDVALLKKLIGEAYTPLIVGRAFQALKG